MTYPNNQALPVGSRIGVYEIKEVVKISPFHITYRARNHHLNKGSILQEYYPGDLAIRGENGFTVVPKQNSDKEIFEFGLQAFWKQTEILMQIEHPNIAVVENALHFNDTVYWVEEFPEGMLLSDPQFSSETFTEIRIRDLLTSLLSALQKLHANKMVHGGIQPSAVLLCKQGRAVLTDFAEARLAFAARTGKLDSELSAGYAPLEQYQAHKKPGEAADFYASAATIYYCMTHRQPVSVQERLQTINNNQPDPLRLSDSVLNTTYSVNLLATIDWMLRLDSQQRPQSTAEILVHLQQNGDSEQANTVVSEQKTFNSVNSQIEKEPLWIVVMTGIIILMGVGLWLGEKSGSSLHDAPDTVTDFMRTQQPAVQIAVEPQQDEKLALTMIDDEMGQQPVTEQTPEHATEKNQRLEKPLLQSDKEISITKKQSDGIQLDSDKIPVLALTGESQSLGDKPAESKPPVDYHAIKWRLAAAEKAMREMRFTTPVGNSAYEHYQTVLVTDPTNVQALAGLEKIVEWYLHFIEEAQAQGLPNTARVYLQRAEAVMPDEPRLQAIRLQLNFHAGAE